MYSVLLLFELFFLSCPFSYRSSGINAEYGGCCSFKKNQPCSPLTSTLQLKLLNPYRLHTNTMMEASLNYWVQVMVNEEMLDVEMAKSLSLVSRLISNTVKCFIEDNFYFSLSMDMRFAYYQPKNINDMTLSEQINASIKRDEVHCLL
eukprot:TRINITY_DN3335_c0_g3_i6.p1 TRINITY_DN3335_c0_g3~~TRINITY_DN3335_c0_g3_i6.p1  ORF type:complete len:148 (-),score=34.58 TRINITY_DN3335_c0_g3_i6:336-779(-)